MKILILATILCALLICACPELKNSALPSNVNAASPVVNQQMNARQETPTPAIPSETPLPIINFTPKEPMVWAGYASADESVKEIDRKFSIDNILIDDNPKYAKYGMMTEVDIFNCAGYLMSGQAQKHGDYGWEFELMPETVASDALEKMKLCDNFF